MYVSNPHFLLPQLASLLGLPDQVMFGCGVACVLVGVYLRSRLSDYSMRMEDLVKDRRLTEDQARRRLLAFNVLSAVVMVTGFVGCTVVLLM